MSVCLSPSPSVREQHFATFTMKRREEEEGSSLVLWLQVVVVALVSYRPPAFVGHGFSSPRHFLRLVPSFVVFNGSSFLPLLL